MEVLQRISEKAELILTRISYDLLDSYSWEEEGRAEILYIHRFAISNPSLGLTQ